MGFCIMLLVIHEIEWADVPIVKYGHQGMLIFVAGSQT